MGTQRSGKVKFLCRAHRKVILELEGIFFFWTPCVRLMPLYSFSLWAERIRKCLKFEWRFCRGHRSLPRIKNPHLMAFAQIPFFLTLSEYPSLSRLFSLRLYKPCSFHCPFAHCQTAHCQCAFLASMLHPQSPFSRPQLHFSLNIHFHGFNYQFSVVNVQISLLALTLTESSLCRV